MLTAGVWYMRQSAPLMGLTRGISEGSWAMAWRASRAQVLLSSEDTLPPLPAPLGDVAWYDRKLSTSEATAWLHDLLATGSPFRNGAASFLLSDEEEKHWTHVWPWHLHSGQPVLQRSNNSSHRQTAAQPFAAALDVVSIDDQNLEQQNAQPHVDDQQFHQCRSIHL
eukprot:2247555-Amphidinium_carterae.1